MAYTFGDEGSGALCYSFPASRRPSTDSDRLAFGFSTAAAQRGRAAEATLGGRDAEATQRGREAETTLGGRAAEATIVSVTGHGPRPDLIQVHLASAPGPSTCGFLANYIQ